MAEVCGGILGENFDTCELKLSTGVCTPALLASEMRIQAGMVHPFGGHSHKHLRAERTT